MSPVLARALLIRLTAGLLAICVGFASLVPFAYAQATSVMDAPSAESTSLASSASDGLPDNLPPQQKVGQPLTAYPPEGTPVPPRNPDDPVGWVTYKTPYEVWLTGCVVALLIGSVATLSILAWRSGALADFNRTFVITIIVFAALFLITAGYSDKQAAPAYALLGTIAGYLFGRMDKDRAANTGTNPDANQETQP